MEIRGFRGCWSFCVKGLICRRLAKQGSRSLCRGIECNPGLEEMPEVLSLPNNSRDGEISSALEQQRERTQDKKNFPSAMQARCSLLLLAPFSKEWERRNFWRARSTRSLCEWHTAIKIPGTDFSPKRKGMEPGTILNACLSRREERGRNLTGKHDSYRRARVWLGGRKLVQHAFKTWGSSPAHLQPLAKTQMTDYERASLPQHPLCHCSHCVYNSC